MSDEIKLKAECRNKINRAGMTIIAEKRVENQLVDNSNNEGRDALSVLRMSPFVLKFFWFTIILSQVKSYQLPE